MRLSMKKNRTKVFVPLLKLCIVVAYLLLCLPGTFRTMFLAASAVKVLEHECRVELRVGQSEERQSSTQSPPVSRLEQPLSRQSGVTSCYQQLGQGLGRLKSLAQITVPPQLLSTLWSMYSILPGDIHSLQLQRIHTQTKGPQVSIVLPFLLALMNPSCACAAFPAFCAQSCTSKYLQEPSEDFPLQSAYFLTPPC